MLKLKSLLILLISFLGLLQSCNKNKTDTLNAQNQSKFDDFISDSTKIIDGLSFVAPPDPFNSDPFVPIKNIGAEWISVIPYGFNVPGKTDIRYGSKWQWWGEQIEGIEETIQNAHNSNLKVMLKPQVFVPGSWTGGLEFTKEEDWIAWENSYKKFMEPFIKIAVNMNVDLLCIGTEFTKSTAQRTEFWENFIKEIRTKYKGKLTYAANWDEYSHIKFWSDLDFTGINAYFPLLDKTTPEVPELIKAWKPLASKMEYLCIKTGKPVLFTEYGYLSVDRCSYNTWEIEKNIESAKVNELAQANALEALYTVFNNRIWWKGGFLWKWFPELKGHEGYLEKDYTPQGKLSEQIVKKWFHQ